MEISFGLCRLSSGQNIYKNLNAGLYNVLFVNVMESHLQSYISLYLMSAVVVLSIVSLTKICYMYIVKILKLLLLILIVLVFRGYIRQVML
jgi:hypothetical protein